MYCMVYTEVFECASLAHSMYAMSVYHNYTCTFRDCWRARYRKGEWVKERRWFVITTHSHRHIESIYTIHLKQQSADTNTHAHSQIDRVGERETHTKSYAYICRMCVSSK